MSVHSKKQRQRDRESARIKKESKETPSLFEALEQSEKRRIESIQKRVSEGKLVKEYFAKQELGDGRIRDFVDNCYKKFGFGLFFYQTGTFIGFYLPTTHLYLKQYEEAGYNILKITERYTILNDYGVVVIPSLISDAQEDVTRINYFSLNKDFDENLEFLQEVWKMVEDDLQINTKYSDRQVLLDSLKDYCAYKRIPLLKPCDVDFDFLYRNCLNYIRHRLSNYDEILDEAELSYNVIYKYYKSYVIQQIKEAYPNLKSYIQSVAKETLAA